MPRTLLSQYAAVAPVYPLPMMTTSASAGSSSVVRCDRKGDSAPSIQNDLVALVMGKTMMKVMRRCGQLRQRGK
jgi:hypothetical protein